MNKFLIALLALWAFAGLSFGKTKKRRTSTTAKSHVVARKGKKPVVTSARRSYQATPTTERYQEIQQSLAARGYFKGDVNGQWGPESVDALQRFQKDQNLETDGKLGSLSLIAMGLGPKRMTAQSKPTPPTVVPNQKKEQP